LRAISMARCINASFFIGCYAILFYKKLVKNY
jgi:hypothetical protein